MVPAINIFGNRTHELEDKGDLFFDDNIDNVPLAINIPASGKALFFIVDIVGEISLLEAPKDY